MQLHRHGGVLLVGRGQHQPGCGHRHQRRGHAGLGLVAFPVAECGLECASGLRHVEVAAGAKLRMARAVEAPVEVAQLLRFDGFQVGCDVVEIARVAHVAARVRVAVAGKRYRHHRLGLPALLLHSGESLADALLEHGLGKRGLAQKLAEQRDDRRQVLAPCGDVEHHRTGARRNGELGLQGVEPVADLFAREFGGAFVEHGGHHGGHFALLGQAVHVAKAQHQACTHHVAARGLGEHGGLQTAGELEALGLGVDVRGRGVKSRHRRRRRLRLEAPELRGHIGLHRQRRAHRLVGGHIGRERAVRRQQALACHALQVAQRERLDAVTDQEE